MASLGTYGDSLRVCWTGVRGGANTYDPAYSLGGERLGETVHVKAIIDDPIPSLRIRGFSATTSTGTGYISASVIGGVMYASYSAPGDDYGPAATLANGDTVLLVSDNEADTVRVERVSSDDNGGVMTLTVVEQHGAALAGGNVDESSTDDVYRALMIHNAGSGSITNLKIWIEPISATGVTTTTYMSGAFTSVPVPLPKTVGNATGTPLADWPESGYARIEDSGGTLREVVYYPSRTDNYINVFESGAGMVGTSHTNGTATDVMYPVSGIAIAKETPSSGAIQTVADENTAPAAVTWNREITSTGGLSEATLAADGELGLWIHRETVSDVVGPSNGNPALPVRLGLSWTFDGDSYTAVLQECFTKRQTDGAWYRMYVGENVAITADDIADEDWVSRTTSLPIYKTITPPVSGETDFYVVVTGGGQTNLQSRNVYNRVITVDSAGDQVVSSHTAPVDVEVSDTAGGHVLIRASYYDDEDTTAADTFRIYISTDGDDPDTGTDTPVEVAMVRRNFMRPGYHLRYETPASYPYSTDFRVLVTSYNSDDTTESNNTTATTHTVGTDTQPNWDSKAWTFIGANRRHYEAPDDTVSETETTDATNGVYVEVGVGWAEFYAGTALVWKVFYDSLRPDKTAMYIPSDWALVNATYAGAGTDDLIETDAWNGSKHLYIPVGIAGAKTRRVFIDVDAKQIRCAEFQAQATLPDVNPEAPIASYPAHTIFQVYDAATHRWVPYLSVNDASNGSFHTSIDINQSLSQAQIEAL